METIMAGITISIVAGADAAHSSVNATGSVQHVITDKERASFGVQDAALKNAVGKYFGKNPNDAYLHSPTPWNDLYKTYGWPEVQTLLVVQSAQITGITSQPVVVATKTFTNRSSKKAVFDASISDQVSNTTESNWSTTNTIEVAQKFTYNVGFLGAGGGGETSMSYSHQWGQGGSETKSITVGSSSGVSVELEPGESIEAQLAASRGVMKVRITYQARLIGSTAINYNPTFKDHHFWALDIGGVMQAGGLKNSIQFTEDIEVGYFSNAKIELRDPQGKLKNAVLAVPALEPVLA
jgi:hypothetical protein